MDILHKYENITFDILIIICNINTLIISILTLLLIYIRRSTRQKDRINNLLTINPFLSLVIVSSFTLDMYSYTLYGHIHSNISFNGWWCKIKSFCVYSSGASFMYSLFLHAIYRFCRIVFPMRPYLRSFRLYRYGIIIQWLICIISILIILFFDDIRYVIDDYNCQIELINIRGMLILIPIGYSIPTSLTSLCYNYTLYYYRKHNTTIRIDIRQRIKTRRDIYVLKRIFLILTFMIVVGFPTLVMCIIYYIFHYLPWWSRQLGWLSLALAYGSAPLILIITSPPLRRLWTKRWHRIHP